MNDLFGEGNPLPPVSRMSDPDTSKMAEEFINRIGSRRTHVLLFLELLDQYERDYRNGLENVDMTAGEMGTLLHRVGSITLRCAVTAPIKRLGDLRNGGYAVVTGSRPDPDTGRMQQTWRITEKGETAYSLWLDNYQPPENLTYAEQLRNPGKYPRKR
jgi:hypothetical protein